MAIHNPFEFWGPLVRFLPPVSYSYPVYIAIHNAFGFGAIGSFFTNGFFRYGDSQPLRVLGAIGSFFTNGFFRYGDSQPLRVLGAIGSFFTTGFTFNPFRVGTLR